MRTLLSQLCQIMTLQEPLLLQKHLQRDLIKQIFFSSLVGDQFHVEQSEQNQQMLQLHLDQCHPEKAVKVVVAVSAEEAGLVQSSPLEIKYDFTLDSRTGNL